MRPGDDAIMLCMTGIDYVTNDILNGTFRADFINYHGTPEINGNLATTKPDNLLITHSDDSPAQRPITFRVPRAKKHLSDLVGLKDMNVSVEKGSEATICSIVENR